MQLHARNEWQGQDSDKKNFENSFRDYSLWYDTQFTDVLSLDEYGQTIIFPDPEPRETYGDE